MLTPPLPPHTTATAGSLRKEGQRHHPAVTVAAVAVSQGVPGFGVFSPSFFHPGPGRWGGQSPGSPGREVGSSSSLVNNTLPRTRWVGRGGSEGQGVFHLERRNSEKQMPHHQQGRERGGSGRRRQESAQRTEGRREKERWHSAIFPRETIWRASRARAPGPSFPGAHPLPTVRSPPVRCCSARWPQGGGLPPAENGV